MIQLADLTENPKNARAISDEPVGTAAAMREALVAVKKSIDGIGELSLDCDPTILMAALTLVCARLSARIERALAAPPRNCDVGTSDEQKERFDAFCDAQPRMRYGCDCNLQKNRQGLCEGLCEFAWAQMPYAAEEQETP